MTMYLAHFVIDHDKGNREQTLREHCRNVAEYASECMETAGFGACAFLAGLLHDGKGTEKFQTYLRQSAAWSAFDEGKIEKPRFTRPQKGSVNHTFAGTIYLMDKHHDMEDPNRALTAEILSCAISAHHGLFDCMSLDGENGFVHRIREDRRAEIQYEQAKYVFEHEVSSPEEIDELFEKSCLEVQDFLKALPRYSDNADSIFMQLSMAVRMLASALMYADRRDTAEFMDESRYGDIQGNWENDIRDFEEKYRKLNVSVGSGNISPLNRTRRDISEQCRKFADNPGGIYRLNVPTGGGKTLSSLRYSLYHAKQFKKKKIIYIIPLLTIIDQNAAEIESYLPEETILEHHSDIAREDMTEGELREYDLLRDRWEAPVIITTLVQILDVFFSDKTSAVTRLRALANSVMIFDEVQSVPMKTLAMFNSALNYLADFCGTTVILCSATQPEFNSLKSYPLHISDKRMISLTDEQYQIFRRQKYHDLSGKEITLDELAARSVDIVQRQNPLMVVCNTKSEARQLYRTLTEEQQDLLVMHLSAGMCKAHRKKVIEAVRGELSLIQDKKDFRRFILVTTQIVEAGVNMSFRSVIRILAGNDNLVQSGGRCNRSNEYESGDVYLMRVQGENTSLRQLPDIRNAQSAMVDTVYQFRRNDEFDPEAPAFISEYYRKLFRKTESDREILYPFQYKTGMKYFMAALLSNRLSIDADEQFLLHQPFKTAGEYFKVFEENTYEVIVPFEEGRELIESMKYFEKSGAMVPAELYRKAGDYSVQIFEWQKKKLDDNRMLENYSGGHFYYLNQKAYDESGLNAEAKWDMDDFMV